MNSGFVAVVGRTGVGKSTLVNRMVGDKVSITSTHSNTTRSPVRGVRNTADSQIVFVDTPGFHRPKTALGKRLNSAASNTIPGVDIVLFVIDATAPLGTGDRFVAERVPKDAICVVNKVDRAKRDEVVRQLIASSELDMSEYFPVSARTGEGVDELVATVAARLPEGPRFYPSGIVSDTPEAAWVAELVREQLLAHLREELPHSVACRVTEWDGPYIRCEILVERESQKGIVVGSGGLVLKNAGIAVREMLPEGSYLDLVVKVEKDWQQREDVIDRLGYGLTS